MDLGFIGLGRMGANMVRRLLGGGHRIVAYNRSPDKVKQIVEEGAEGAFSLEELAAKLIPPRAVWLMIPEGDPVNQHIRELKPLLARGDIVIDGGNAYFKNSVARGKDLAESGILFTDVGTSGGIWGLKNGYCLMIGGDESTYRRLEPIFSTLAPPDGYLYCGPSGSGHFVKMIHNGIEYGMLQAYGEGFEIMKASPYKLDFGKIAHLWNQGSVVRSWLLELAEAAFQKDPTLASLKGYVADSGEGRWTVQTAMEEDIPAPVITLSLLERFRSRQEESFSAKVIAALRQEFGGHPVKEAVHP
ncbi:MAG: decarboxylating 6-phosphogluconate dehydrogenase [Armatimonadetes bacterium]|nr:decarboxylating 6-phosphogluconate dehydrogenase [Armatimonadota bacterium]